MVRSLAFIALVAIAVTGASAGTTYSGTPKTGVVNVGASPYTTCGAVSFFSSSYNFSVLTLSFTPSCIANGGEGASIHATHLSPRTRRDTRLHITPGVTKWWDGWVGLLSFIV